MKPGSSGNEAPVKPLSIPVWMEGFLLQGASLLAMWLSSREALAGALVSLFAVVRLAWGRPFERMRFGIALLLGVLFELSMWRSGAIRYHASAAFVVPVWIFALWGLGGVLVAGIVSGDPDTSFRRRFLALLPLGVLCLAPTRWTVGFLSLALALLSSLFLFSGEKGEFFKKPPWRRLLATVLVGIGGMSASFSFGMAGVCSFPQAWHGIPPWAVGLWASFAVALYGLSR